MAMPLTFTYAKLTEAVGVFVTHEEDARRRLLAAELPLSLVSSDSLPEPYAKQWSELWFMLTAKGACHDFTPFKCTVLHMRKKRAAQFIGEIWNLWSMLDAHIPRGPFC